MFDGPTTAAPTPRDIAAGVKYGPLEKLAVSSYVKRREALREAQASLLSGTRAYNDTPAHRGRPSEREINERSAEVERLKDAMAPVRQAHNDARSARSTRVAEALAETRAAAARRALDALLDLQRAADVLAECAGEVSRAGGEVAYIHLPSLAAFEALARRIVG